jgi:hypothetical protein
LKGSWECATGIKQPPCGAEEKIGRVAGYHAIVIPAALLSVIN